MEKTEHIILINFSTKAEALSYLQNIGFGFSFSVNSSEFFDELGALILEPETYQMYDVDTISISNKIDPLPGELYIENGFLKYYKEL